MKNNESVLVSIGVLNYNSANYIIETLDSIYAQTYSNIELIISDDFSTDHSVEMIEKWLQRKKERFTNVVLIKAQKNGGICKSANLLLQSSKGAYFSLFSCDDIMLPEKTERQLQLLENTGSDVAGVYSDAYMVQEDSSPRYGWLIQRFRPDFIEIPSGNVYEAVLQKGFIPATSTLIKKEVFDKCGIYDERLRYEDWDMWLRISKQFKILYSDFVSIKYRVRKDSISQVTTNYYIDDIDILQKHLDQELAKQKLRAILLRAYAEGDIVAIKKLKQIKQKIPGSKSIFKAISLRLPYIFYRLYSAIKKRVNK